jgi:pyruvate/2-oxoglutarate dehydrogenase complex dihydrolipoamide dehydrogenase (E3) component
MTAKLDAIVIGTGQAGPPLAARLTAAGMKVAVIERKLLGGTCVNTGCIPTKAMVASAHAAHLAYRAWDFGVSIDRLPRVDMKRVKARKDAISEHTRAGVETWLRNMQNCTVHQGQAEFEQAHRIRVGETLLEADRIFINVGARAVVPSLSGLAQVRYLTNSSLLDLDDVPPHLVIVGGSFVGLEFAQMFRRFGRRVTIIEMSPNLIHREDEDVSAGVKAIMEGEGIDLRLNAKCIGVAGREGGVTVGYFRDGRTEEVSGTHLLLAVGRAPNTHDLGLDRAGIARDERGYIVVDNRLQTNVPGVWALGDCNGRGVFTHTSYDDFEIVAANLLDQGDRRVTDRIAAYNLYIDPPPGRAGLTEAQVRRSGKRALVGIRPMTRVGRAVEKGETQGFMKVIVDADTRDILGAAILGTSGDEVIHCILDVMCAKAPYTTLQRAMHIHPTVSELIPTLLGELKPLS